MGRFINGARKVFAYLVVALCVASTLAVVELDSSLDSIDQHNEDLIEIAETGGMSGARQRVSLDLGEEEAADDWEGDMLQRGGAKKMVKGMAEKATRRKATRRRRGRRLRKRKVRQRKLLSQLSCLLGSGQTKPRRKWIKLLLIQSRLGVTRRPRQRRRCSKAPKPTSSQRNWPIMQRKQAKRHKPALNRPRGR